MSKKSSVRATFDSEQKYEDFVKALKNPFLPLGKWKITRDPISYHPGPTVTITCEEEDVERIREIISKHGRQVP